MEQQRLSKQQVNAQRPESVDGSGPARKHSRPPIFVIEEVLEQRRLSRQRVNVQRPKIFLISSPLFDDVPLKIHYTLNFNWKSFIIRPPNIVLNKCNKSVLRSRLWTFGKIIRHSCCSVRENYVCTATTNNWQRYSHPQLQPPKVQHKYTYSCKNRITRKGITT